MTQPSLFDLAPQVPAQPLRPAVDQVDPCALMRDLYADQPTQEVIWPR